VDNNREFIELYNAGSQAVDLSGWSLWYRLDDNKEEALVYAWTDRSDVPAHGHYLLVRTGQDVGNVGDVEYEIALFEKRGGLALRNPDGEMVDTLVWGEGPADYVTGTPAGPPENGASLERLPGGEAGNAFSSGDNAADFFPSPNPNPQNSGDALTPMPSERLAIRLDGPRSVEPGSEAAYTVEIQNVTRGAVHDVRAVLPLPPEFELLSAPAGGREIEGAPPSSGAPSSQGGLEWIIPELADGASQSGTFVVQAPWTYLSTLIRGYYVESSDWDARAYGPLLPLAVEGGSIPIATARTLKGKTVTVEGIANMYTGGYYAGTTGTKFYLEDETGGIQAYCPDGQGAVEVEVGDRVRVTGLIDVYRDSIEIIPTTYTDDVEVLERGAAEPAPASVTLQEATSEETLLGRLIAVEGLATRIEELSYSYEVDLVDELGNLLLVNVEKDTGATTELMDTGTAYRVTGISELYDGQWQIKPRYQADLVELYPPELMLEIHARNSVQPGETITYSLTAYNHTDEPLSNVQIVAVPPAEGVSGATILDGGLQADDAILWTLPELAGGGDWATVRYLVTVDDEASGPIAAGEAQASADQWPDPVAAGPLLTFVGSSVPIWAIQGPGARSPYVRDQATTEGIVIGTFPGLGGFWIQEAESDEDPATSAGLFVLSGELEAPVERGDRVQVHGRVREVSGQTSLEVTSLEDVTVLSSGHELPPDVALDPPNDEGEAAAYYEALEGMLVAVAEPAVVVGPTNAYGETPMVLSKWGIDRVFRGDPKGMLIFVDDGSAVTYDEYSDKPLALQTGDVVESALGPLAYIYGNYKIEILYLPGAIRTDRPLPSVEPAGPEEFSVATFNVENLFDPSEPHPTDPPIPTTAQYKRDLAKTADVILAMGAPTVVGLQEVENVEILADLAEEGSVAGFDYEPLLIEGTDSRGIDVGYLVRGDQATVEGVASYPAPEGLTSRPPLLITVTVHLAGGDETVYVLNNHFTSMSGGEAPTEPRRVAQAEWNVTLVERILANEPEANVIVLGDLNSFYDSPPLDVFRESGWHHVYEFVAPQRLYTYVYQGESETLDHILVTQDLYERLARVEALHVNADYPLPLADDTSAPRMSDHDPLIAVFSFE
jgi:predicted extracellular nuclease